MRRSTTTERTAARPRYLTLQCPECTHGVRVARDELIEDATAFCRSCGAESVLAQGFNGDTGRKQWLLLDPLVDFDEEDEERRA